MRRLILLAFVSTFSMRDVTLSKIQEYPSNLAWLFGISKNANMKEKRAVCESEECKKMADFILGGMDRSVNPCDDFYEYACGKWPEKNTIPEGLSNWDIWIKLQLKTHQQLQEIVQSKITENDLPAVKLAKKWYKACMDTDAIEKEGIDPLVSTLSCLGGWPMTMEPDKWDERKYSWEKVDDQYMRLTARNAFYDVHIKKDSEDPKRVEIDIPHLPPGSKKLWSLIESDSKEKDEEENKENKSDSKSDEDPSNEDEQSNEEPGSESEDDSNTIEDDDNDDNDDNDNDDNDDDDDNDGDDGSGDDNNDDDNNNDDNDDDNGSGDDDNDDDGSGNDNDDDGSGNDNDDNDDDDDDTHEQDEDVKKEISKKKITSKIDHERSKKLRHVGQKKSGIRIIKKHDSHNKMKRQRIRRWATKVNNKQRFIRRKKLHTQKGKRDHVRKVHRKKTKKILGNAEIMYATIPQESSERTKKILESYTNYISKVAYIIAKNKGTKISEERLAEDIQDMIKFQLKLIQIAKESISNSIYYMEITLRDFQEWYDNENPKTNKGKINWVSKIKALFDEAYEFVDDDLIINIISPNYIKKLLSLLDETSSRTIVNYIHWNFISKIIKTTTSEMKNLYDAWENISKDENETPKMKLRSRASICIDSAEIKEILAYEFVRKYFSDKTIKIASDMLNDIKKEVKKLIKDSDWLDEETKDFFIEKVKHMKKSIGYPDWYKNTTIMQEYLRELVIGPSYYENALRYNRYVKLESLRKLSKNNDEIDENLKLDPTEINAFYVPYKNILSITAADFQSPWFAYGRPQAVNFGIIGFLMAHEVNHGFDHTGRMFDENGDYLNCFPMMAQAYDKKENCFINQFNNYSIDSKTNKKIENYGEQTIDDNIADTMGLQAIFKTFQSKEKKSKTPDAALPGMEDFTNDQLFFLSFSTLWCEANKYTSSEIIDFAKNDDHSVERLRVIGSVSNSDDFAKAYNCPVGSPMNPEKKCNIWK